MKPKAMSEQTAALRSRKLLAAATLMALHAAAAAAPFAGELRGKVVGVTDGDTITVLDAGKAQHEVRLRGIDAPETTCHQRLPDKDRNCTEQAQPYGKASKKHLSMLVYGQEVKVKLSGEESYGRKIGTVFLDGVDVNLAQLQSGYAWMSPEIGRTLDAGTRRAYTQAQDDARVSGLGLWGDRNAQAPWLYRTQTQQVNGRLAPEPTVEVQARDGSAGVVGIGAKTVTIRDFLRRSGVPVPPANTGYVNHGAEIRKAATNVFKRLQGEPEPGTDVVVGTTAPVPTAETPSSGRVNVGDGARKVMSGVGGFFRRAAETVRDAKPGPSPVEEDFPSDPERARARP